MIKTRISTDMNFAISAEIAEGTEDLKTNPNFNGETFDELVIQITTLIKSRGYNVTFNMGTARIEKFDNKKGQ